MTSTRRDSRFEETVAARRPARRSARIRGLVRRTCASLIEGLHTVVGRGAQATFIVVSLTVVAACASEPYHPQYADALDEPWRIRTFPELSGLGAQGIAEDAQKTLWFVTLEGVWSYDGFDWVRHSEEGCPAGGDAIGISDEGSVLIAGGWQIVEYKNGAWSRAFPPGSDRPQLAIRKITTGRDGSLWAACSLGALACVDSRWTLYTSSDVASRLAPQQLADIRVVAFPQSVLDKQRPTSPSSSRHDFVDVCIDPQGRVWLCTHEGEVVRFTPASDENSDSSPRWDVYNELDGLASGRIPSIVALRDGSVWLTFGADARHICIYEDERWRRVPLGELGLPVGCGKQIQTNDGTVWISGRYALAAYRAGQWKTYSAPAYPIPHAQNFLFQSSDGALWIGGPNTEIVRVDYQTRRWETLEDLNFQWESPVADKWFLHRSGRLVVNRNGKWTSYGAEDGAIDAPVALIGTASGDVWVAGSHEREAATARFDGRRWNRQVHDELSWGIDYRGVLESSDGSIWFAAAVDSGAPAKHRAGILQFKDGRWIHHHEPGREPSSGDTSLLPSNPVSPSKLLLLGESRDGQIWAGRSVLIKGSPGNWKRVPRTELEVGTIISILTTANRELWLGTQQFGVLRHDGQRWSRFQVDDGWTANSVYSLTQSTDGSVWAATDRGFCRFDGMTWNSNALPRELSLLPDGGSLKPSRSGGVWINHCTREWTLRAWENAPGRFVRSAFTFRTTEHRLEGPSPRTSIIHPASAEISHPGSFSALWTGAAQWRDASDAQLQYSHRLDDRPWSPFVSERGASFFDLPAGTHRLEVRARDSDFNVDPTPATFDFVVLAPVWRQPWFVGMLTVFTGLIAAQSYRVVQERARLRRANADLGAEIEERIRTQDEIRATNIRYARQEAALMALTRSHALQQVGAAELTREIVEVAAETLGGRRACIWVFRGDLSALVCRDCYDLDTRTHSGGATLDADEFPGFFAAVTAGAMFRVEDVHADPRTSELAAARFHEAGGGALLAVPIHVAGNLAGVLAAEHAGSPRRWRSDEETFAISAANMISLLFSEEKRQQAEERLSQSQKLEAIGQLAGGVAHDFNNILAAMIMQIELIRLNKEHPDKVTEGLEEMQSSAERAAGLTRQLLLFGSKQMMQTRWLDLNAEVGQIVRMLERIIGEHVVLRLQLLPTPLPLEADAGMLDQVLVNLAVNARDAMPAGGELVIETSELTVSEVLSDFQPHATPGQYACLKVRDTGVGIPPDHLPRILDPFFTTKEPGKGTGLGLATVFGIVKQHNGCLRVESKVTAGTTFTILLPLATGERPRETPQKALPAQAEGGKETILLVEDEPEVRRLTQAVLEQHGYKVLTAADGAEALSIWKRHAERIELLLTDLVIPGALGGQEVARQIQLDNPEVKVVYMTGYSPEIAGKEFILRDAENFIAKPFTREAILAKIRDCFAS